MRFPAVDRVVYKRTSLVEVIAQVKFTPVLRIDTDVPSVVQEVMRKNGLPEYERQDFGFPVGGLALPMQLPPEVMDRRAEHGFYDAGNQSRVTLGRDFVALSQRNYARWEGFESVLSRALAVVMDTYQPHALTRIGLRYQNVISRKALGVDGVPWTDLLLPSLLGLLAEDDEWRPTGVSRQELYSLDVTDGLGAGRIVHGTVTRDGDPEIAYLIDSDFYVERDLQPSQLDDVLADLHTQSRSFFRHCVRDRLHHAMQPEGS